MSRSVTQRNVSTQIKTRQKDERRMHVQRWELAILPRVIWEPVSHAPLTHYIELTQWVNHLNDLNLSVVSTRRRCLLRGAMLQCNQEAFVAVVVVVVSGGRQPTRQCVHKSIPGRLNPSFGFVSAVTVIKRRSVVWFGNTTQFARVGACGRVTGLRSEELTRTRLPPLYAVASKTSRKARVS